MVPAVHSDLVTLADDAATEIGVTVQLLPQHEKGGPDPETHQQVQDGGGAVGVWPVVEGDRDMVGTAPPRRAGDEPGSARDSYHRRK